MARRSRRSQDNGSNNSASNDEQEEIANEEPGGADTDATNNGSTTGRQLPAAMRQRNRAVAEREASRLARPERRSVSTLGHASKLKSAVSSTPFGQNMSLSKSGSSPNRHSVTEEDEWCGPFSVARQMIAKREEARRKREEEREQEHDDTDGDGSGKKANGERHPLDEIMSEFEMEKKRKAHPSLTWRSRVLSSTENNSHDNQSYYAKRQRRIDIQSSSDAGGGKIPSLFDLCVKFLCDNFEHVEALGDVGSVIRRSICESLVASNKLNGQAFNAIAETGIEALELIDCAEVTSSQLAEALKRLIPAGLQFLSLNHSGRCFSQMAVNAIIESKPQLCAISIGGAYSLKDADASSFIESISSTVSSIEFKACPLLGNEFCNSLSKNFSAGNNTGCLLELSLEDLPITKENLLSIVASHGNSSNNGVFGNLKSLKLRQMESVDDDVVLRLLSHVGDNLESVDLSYNYNLSDDVLSGIRRANESGKVRSLVLSGLKNLTSVGLEALFTPGIEGLPSPPMLRSIDVAGCSHDAVTDLVMDLVAKASSMKRINDNENTSSPSSKMEISNSLSSMGGLVYVNINGSSCTDDSMEALAATSASSLRELDVSFCPNITDKGLGYLVDSVSTQFKKVHIWGCAQITDDFLDGHHRALDGTFESVGAWMKKAGGRSLR